MAKEWSPSTLVDALVAAGAKGMTKSALEKKNSSFIPEQEQLHPARFEIGGCHTRTVQEAE